MAEEPAVPVPALSVSAVAARLGVAPSTLRTWDRRYNLGPSEHTAGSHRRYTGGDVARLMIMRRLTLEGIAPADAAQIALATAVDNQTPSILAAEEDDRLRGMPLTTAPTGAVLSSYAALSGTITEEKIFGFTPQQLGSRDYDTEICLALTNAARSFDEVGAAQLVQLISDVRGIGDMWAQVVKKAVIELLTSADLVQPGMDPLSIVKLAVMMTLRRAARHGQERAKNPKTRKAGVSAAERVMVCASPDDVSSMGAHVLAAALNQANTPASVLLGQVKDSVVQKTLRADSPAVIVAVSWLEPSGQMDSAIRTCLEEAPGVPVLLNGPGWGKKIPAGAHRMRSFIGALHEAQAYAG